MPKCPPSGGVRLQEVSVSGGSTVHHPIRVHIKKDYNLVRVPTTPTIRTTWGLRVHSFGTILAILIPVLE